MAFLDSKREHGSLIEVSHEAFAAFVDFAKQ
jgi:hypothetical protein